MEILQNTYQKQLLKKIRFFFMIDPLNEYQKIIQIEIIFDYMYDNYDQIHGYYFLINSKKHRNFYNICRKKAKYLLLFLTNEKLFCCDKFEQKNCENTIKSLKKYISKKIYPIDILLTLHRKINDHDLVHSIMEFL